MLRRKRMPATPPRGEFAQKEAEYRKQNIQAGPAAARKRKPVAPPNNDAPAHKPGEIPSTNMWNYGPSLSNTVVLTGPGFNKSRNEMAQAWSDYARLLNARPLPSNKMPATPHKPRPTKRRRTYANRPENANKEPAEGTNVRKPRGGSRATRKRSTRRSA